MKSYPEAYLLYLVHFHGDRDWFECHEILEEYWKSSPPNGRNPLWVGLIQIAVGLYHQRRGNSAGARKMLQSALLHLNAEGLSELGLDAEITVGRIQQRLKEIDEPATARFEDMNLPIADETLLLKCKELSLGMGLTWETSSRLEASELIHRHTLRDRRDVIEARQAEAERRRLRREVEP